MNREQEEQQGEELEGRQPHPPEDRGPPAFPQGVPHQAIITDRYGRISIEAYQELVDEMRRQGRDSGIHLMLVGLTELEPEAIRRFDELMGKETRGCWCGWRH